MAISAWLQTSAVTLCSASLQTAATNEHGASTPSAEAADDRG